MERPSTASARAISALKKRSRSLLGGEGGLEDTTASFAVTLPVSTMPAAPAPRSPRGAPAPPRGGRLVQALLRRERALDWAFVALGVIILAATDRAPPARGPPYILKAALPDLAHPLLPNTVPSWSVPVIGVVLPAALLAVHVFMSGRSTEELHQLLLGLLGSVILAGAITNALKITVQRPRPDFVPRCWPGGKPAWDKEDEFGGYPACSGDPHSVAEGLKSFPSGHSSWSAAGLGYLSCVLLDLLQPLEGGAHVWRLFLGLSPALGACAVGVSRYVDYWHHPTDVMAGLALGFLSAWLVYLTVRGQGPAGGGGGGWPAGGAGLPLASASAAGLQQQGGGEDELMQQPLLARGGIESAAAAAASRSTQSLPV